MRKLIIYIIIFILIIIPIIWYNVDVKINSKIFIETTIKDAFDKRISGDLNGFIRNLVDTTNIALIIKNDTANNKFEKYKKDLRFISWAEKEQKLKIIHYKIEKITYAPYSDKAFVLIQLRRFIGYETQTFNTYTLVRINNIWKIKNLNNDEFLEFKYQLDDLKID